ncbi:MAG: histidine--tRNA ligase [Cardiobacteriaceae bacterium]|nr:histidine--tRNA ligase [Cardiobacteriaceae bacterium]
MSEMVTSVRGMRTILGAEAQLLERLHEIAHELLHQFGYQPIALPLVEKTSLFKRAVGEETDVVNKEMYTFLDRNEESLTLRPEATAGVVRAMIELGQLQQVQRLYAEGAMFRYEKPQKGRYRQFNQISVEAFGMQSPALDVELIQLAHELFTRLGVRDKVKLELNTIGQSEERKRFAEALVSYLTPYKNELDEDSQRRLTTNPLRILDSKDPKTQALLEAAPVLDDYLGEESRGHFSRVCQMLDDLGISYVRNPRLVRGLDYYNHTVIEWTTDALGAQGTITAGGRYDHLIEHLGGKSTPAAGFAFGVDRIALLWAETVGMNEEKPRVYGIAASDKQQSALLKISQKLREIGVSVWVQADSQALKKQIQKADKFGAEYALIIGDSEQEAGVYTLKNLRTGEQQMLTSAELINHFQA